MRVEPKPTDNFRETLQVDVRERAISKGVTFHLIKRIAVVVVLHFSAKNYARPLQLFNFLITEPLYEFAEYLQTLHMIRPVQRDLNHGCRDAGRTQLRLELFPVKGVRRRAAPFDHENILAQRSVVSFEAVAPELSDSRRGSVRKRRLERSK